MNRYRVVIAPGLLEHSFECEAETAQHAQEIAADTHPGQDIGMAFRLGAIPGVPKKRPANSRYHLADVDKMGADGASPLRGQMPKSARRRRRAKP